LVSNLLSLPRNSTDMEKKIRKACKMASELSANGHNAPKACKELCKVGWMLVIHRICNGEGQDHGATGDSEVPEMLSQGVS
jgi:hypothetical protein